MRPAISPAKKERKKNSGKKVNGKQSAMPKSLAETTRSQKEKAA
jgi:hypothetical protein